MDTEEGGFQRDQPASVGEQGKRTVWKVQWRQHGLLSPAESDQLPSGGDTCLPGALGAEIEALPKQASTDSGGKIKNAGLRGLDFISWVAKEEYLLGK